LANLEFSIVGGSTARVGLAHTGNTFVALYLFIYLFVLCGNRNTFGEKKKKNQHCRCFWVRVLVVGCDG
jgi:hypothetical protein